MRLAQFRNGPDRAGFVQKSVVETAGIPGLVQKWSAATGGPVQSSPVVAAGTAYVGSDDGRLYAYDAGHGAPRWNRDTSAAIVAAPAVANGVVFVGSADHTLRVFAASDGTPKWSHPMPTTFGGAGASPAVVGTRVFVSSDDRMYTLNVNDGSEAWSAASGLTGPLSAPAVANNLVYATSYSDGTVVAFHADDGSPVWTTTAPGTRSNCSAVLPSPAVSSGVVYAVVCPTASPAASLLALDANNGAITWSVSTAAYTTSPAVANGMVYAGSSPQKDLEVRRTSDGGLVWAGAIGSAVTSSPAVAGNAVYVGADDGSVYAFDAAGQTRCGGNPRTCQPMWSVATGGRGAVLAGGRRRVRVRRLRRPRAPRLQPSADRVLQEPLAEPHAHRPTVARFGPDGRLYVAQYNGVHPCLHDRAHRQQRVHRHGHRDDQPHPKHPEPRRRRHARRQRSRPALVTGMVVAGTAANPVIYVASSDPRVGGGSRHGAPTSTPTRASSPG